MATNVMLPDDVARRLEEIAQGENRSLAEVVSSLLDQYPIPAEDVQEIDDPILGIFDDDVTDMSTTVRETMDAYWRKKGESYGHRCIHQL